MTFGQLLNIIVNILFIIVLVLTIIYLYRLVISSKRKFNVKYDMGYPYKIEEPMKIYNTDNYQSIVLPNKNYYGNAGPYQDFNLSVDFECDKTNKNVNSYPLKESNDVSGNSLLGTIYNL